MIQLKDFTEKKWLIENSFLNPIESLELKYRLLELKDSGQLKAAGIGTVEKSQIASQIRGDQTFWLDLPTQHPAEKLFFDKLHKIIKLMNENYFLGLKSIECHYAFYSSGTGYQKHIDQIKGKNGRCLTFIFYLNEHWQSQDGGELILYKPEFPTEVLCKIEPKMGKLVIFKSDEFPHAVNTCTKERLSLTGWLRNDA